jgi:hypothetical protein
MVVVFYACHSYDALAAMQVLQRPRDIRSAPEKLTS